MITVSIVRHTRHLVSVSVGLTQHTHRITVELLRILLLHYILLLLRRILVHAASTRNTRTNSRPSQRHTLEIWCVVVLFFISLRRLLINLDKLVHTTLSWLVYTASSDIRILSKLFLFVLQLTLPSFQGLLQPLILLFGLPLLLL